MNILNILGGQWAIEPSKLLEISNIYTLHARGEKIDIAALEAKMGRPLENARNQAEYSLIDGAAVIRIDGVIAKRMNMMTQISGGTSSQMVAQALQNAINDSQAHSIILAIDSPGGTVDGTDALARAVLAARASGKPVVTLASGALCSAAYWVGSAAQAVYIADTTTQVGSIGVVTSHTDISGQQQQQGVKTTEISAGKYKRISSQYGPLTADGKQSIQDALDYTYGLFISAVANHRGVSASTVHDRMADGKVFIGSQAIEAGLVDAIITQDALIEKLNSDRKNGAITIRPQASAAGAVSRYAATSDIHESTQAAAMLTAEARQYMKEKNEPNYLKAIKAVTGRV